MNIDDEQKQRLDALRKHAEEHPEDFIKLKPFSEMDSIEHAEFFVEMAAHIRLQTGEARLEGLGNFTEYVREMSNREKCAVVYILAKWLAGSAEGAKPEAGCTHVN